MVMRMGRILGKFFGQSGVDTAELSAEIPQAILASYTNRPDNVTLMYEIEMENLREPAMAGVGDASQSDESRQVPYPPDAADVSDMEYTSPGTSWDVSDMGYDPSAAVEAPWQVPSHAPAEPVHAGVGSQPCGAPIPGGHCTHMVQAGHQCRVPGHQPR